MDLNLVCFSLTIVHFDVSCHVCYITPLATFLEDSALGHPQKYAAKVGCVLEQEGTKKAW